ncbi:zf-HC2 domain-containing protein [Myxococcus sp. K38C18041901]|uniref:zf-HC2 domain-containing protein n=1 Tax=Myxococcus guangdongensis TaxID=2906760 RepID=UPI0020A77688|nr:zf-HC2 domain-containing protein [Myxococcus guangdongensis]MCP3064582.1 zf-HC2 domain-containing protein [Myxococcus guangdongensis]
MKPQNLHAHEDRLLDFAYGELSTSEAQVVESHLQGCARCTQALDDIRGVRVTMSQLSEEPAPDAGLESLLAYAQQSARRAAAGPEPKPSRWRRWMLPVVGLASVGALGIVSFMAVSPDLTRPNLAQVEARVVKAEPSSVDAPPPPTAGMAPAPAAAAYAESAQSAEAEREQADARLMQETRERNAFGERQNQMARRAEGWDQDGSGGGVGSVSPREASRSKSKGAPSLPAASIPVMPKAAPKDLEKRSAQSDELSPVMEASQGKVARRESLRLGGSSSAKKEASAAMDDALPAGAAWEEAEGAPAMESAAEPLPQAVVAQPPPAPPKDDASIERSLASRSAPAPAKSQEAPLVMRPTSPKAPAAAPEAAKEDKAQRPSVRELSLKAEAAFRDGDRAREAGLLNLALNAGASGTERTGLLNRLCDAELALGRRREGLAACRQVIQESPGSSAAQAARRRLSREADSVETPSEPSQPTP